MPLKRKAPKARMSDRPRDAGECFTKLYLILRYVFDSLLFCLVDILRSARVSSAKFNSQRRLSSDTLQISIKKL